jgi:large subunit ribosomal protein L37Ae
MALAKRDTARQYGTRYGPRNRDKVRAVEKQYKTLQKCPHCAKPAVKRLSIGIWQCNKCDAKFAARAYNIESTQTIEETNNGGL